MTERKSESAELVAERDELMAANKAATSWGAAVGARSGRIKEIDRALSASPKEDQVKIAARKCADDLVIIIEAATRMASRTGNTFVIDRARVASMIAGHFTALRSLAAQDQKPLWLYEDELPEGYPYDAMFDRSEVHNGVRVFPVYTSPPPAAGWPTKCHDPDSCARHQDCMYVDCPYSGTDIKPAIEEALRTTPAATKSADAGGGRPLTDAEQDGINKALLDSGTVVGPLPDHGGADAGVGETLTLDDALEDLHDLLVAGATGEDIKIFAAEHPQFSDQIFAFTEAWFSAGESDE